MSLTLVTAPSTAPVTTAEAKTWMRITHANDDTLIAALVTAATEYCEAFTRRRFVTQTWDLFLDNYEPEILIPYPPCQSITTVKYTDINGTQQTEDSSIYQLDTNSEPARLREAYQKQWSSTRPEMEAVEIRFVCGYGAASAVPERIKSAVKLLASHWYENAEAVISGTISKEIELAVKALLWSERIDI